MAHPEIEAWLNSAEGIAMNPDGHYGLQCVDLADQYAQDIFGVPWPQSMGGVQGAKQLLDAAPDEFWIRTNDAVGIFPTRGDMVVFAGSAINQWGHVAVCLEAGPTGMWVIQQDGFAPPLIWADGNWYSNKPAHKAWLAYSSNGTGPVAGWLTPRTSKLVITLPQVQPQASVAANERVTGPTGVTRRSEPKVADNNVVDTFGGDLILTLGGYVRGQELTVNGLTSNIWYKGGISGGFMWAGGFTSQNVDGLADLTPAPAPAPASNIRITGPDGVNRRSTADKAGNLVDTFGPGLEITIGGYVRAKDPFGGSNPIWYVGGISGGYMWSGGFTSQSTEGLKDLTPVAGAPTPPLPPVYDFFADFDFVEKVPANLTNVQRAVDNPGVTVFPTKPAKIVVHQMGTPGVDTLSSTTSEFKKADTFKSTHFAVSGRHILQFVSLQDRAYHASTAGNVFVGIETDPLQDAATIESTRKLIKALNEKYGYKLELIRHKDVPGNNTSCGTLIDLSKYEVDYAAPVEVPPVVTPPAVDEAGVLRKFFEWLIQLFVSSQKKESK